MAYWVFNDGQLDAALKAYAERSGTLAVPLAPLNDYILDFLRSPEAHAHKLIVEEKR